MSQYTKSGLKNDCFHEIESAATAMAREAGRILQYYFQQTLKVSYKDTRMRNPVTQADHASQTFLKTTINRQFPGHGIVAEEDVDGDTSIAPDFLWIIDPLDGTTNFIHGLPMYACSIGVLYKGEPVVGSLFIPWPNEQRGIILHSRRGGGAFIENSPLAIRQWSAYKGLQLAGLPASLGLSYSFNKRVRNQSSDARTTGSIAYELALVAQGILKYTVHTNPRIWDVAGGIAILLEAGGECIARDNQHSDRKNSKVLFPYWLTGKTTIQEIRDWSIKSLVAGKSGVIEKSTDLLHSRSKLQDFLSSTVRKLF